MSRRWSGSLERTTGKGWRRLRPERWTGLCGFLPFANGIPTAQTLRKVLRLLDTEALQRGFAAWAASLRVEAREVIAVDGKTLRGSKTSPGGTGALHVVSAYATEAGLALTQRAADGKSNEITAIPDLLDMLKSQGRDRVDRRDGDAKGDRPAHRRQRRGPCARAQRQSEQSA